MEHFSSSAFPADFSDFGICSRRKGHESMNTALPARIVFYDGLCGFCDASVQWLLTHDRDATLHFAALQGETAADMKARHPEIPANLDSLLFLEQLPEGERLSWHSTGIFRIAAGLPGGWKLLSWFGILPRFLTDFGYRTFARFRYYVWGRRESCRIPTPAERARFLP